MWIILEAEEIFIKINFEVEIFDLKKRWKS